MEPTTHTGILGAYKATDWLSMQAGILDNAYKGAGTYNGTTVGTGPQNNGLYRPSFTWGPTLTAPDSFGWAKGATLSVATVISGGNTSGISSANGSGATTYYAGITLPTPVAALKFGASFDYLNARDVSANEWAAAIYGTYQFNDKLSLNLRAEYFDSKGINTSGAYLSAPGVFDGQAQELTATVQYALWANVLTRLEFRWDHADHTDIGYVSNVGTYQQDAFLLAAQAVYTF